MQIGTIVKCKNLKFHDNVYDKKKNRPCIVICNIDDENICICPITTSSRTFNKYPDSNYFIPEPIYNYHKLSFAELNNLLIYNKNNVKKCNILLSELTMSQIHKKIIEIYKDSQQKEEIINNISNIYAKYQANNKILIKK